MVLVGLMGFTWSPRRGAAPGARTIRVMTYNIAGGSLGIPRVLDDVTRQRPDIVALQEAQPWGDYLDPSEAILTATPGYEVRRSRQIVVMSRFPILSSKILALPLAVGREYLQVRAATPDGPLTVIATHLTSVNVVHGGGSRRGRVARLAVLHDRQGRAVAQVARAAPPPAIVLGDFNSPPHGPAHRHLSRFGADAFAAAGRGFGYTYSAHRPLVRIDHIFVGPGLRVLRAWTPQVHGSDHRPVVADIALAPAAR